MEALTRMVADSLARHGLDRPVDPRRLQWSRWFRCDSTHSLLVVPSKPGIFALAEEVMDLGVNSSDVGSTDREGHDFSPEPALSKRSAPKEPALSERSAPKEPALSERSAPKEPALSERSAPKGAVTPAINSPALAAEVPQRRMLAVLQFAEDDDMAFTLDRMFTRINPMRDRLASGRCFLRFVVMEDQAQRRSICAALNQWMLSSAEKASGLPLDFSSSLELTRVAEVTRVVAGDSPATAPTNSNSAAPFDSTGPKPNVVSIDSGSAKNLHCPHPLPSGF
jgi:hypothetical protein